MDETKSAGETVQQGQQQTENLSADSVKTMIADAVKATEKTWQSRFDQKNTELTRLKAEKLTVEERAALELKEKEAALENERLSFHAEKVKASRIAATASASLPATFAEYLSGETTEEIATSAKALKGAIDSLVAEKVKLAVYGQSAPMAGSSVDLASLDDASYMAARAKQLAAKGRF